MQNKSNANLNHLYIFNLSTDSDNDVLAFTQDWILSFSHNVVNISVISTWVGKNELPDSIHVRQIGGGNVRRRITALLILVATGIEIVRNRQHALIFHHMSTRTAVILGPLFRIFQIKQGLWYSHSKRTLELVIAEKMVNRIFSTVPQSLPINSKKAIYTGHGIDIKRFGFQTNTQRRLAILSVGRIVPIKKNEALIDAISNSNRKCKEVHLVGPLGTNSEYLTQLIDYGISRGVKVAYLGEIVHSKMEEIYSAYSICYTGSPNTVDKSVIEGAICGTYTLSSQDFVLNQTGMMHVLKKANLDFDENLEKQIEKLDLIQSRDDLRLDLHYYAADHNSVSSATKKIIEEIKRS